MQICKGTQIYMQKCKANTDTARKASSLVNATIDVTK